MSNDLTLKQITTKITKEIKSQFKTLEEERVSGKKDYAMMTSGIIVGLKKALEIIKESEKEEV